MATQWVLDKISDTLAPTVSGAVSTAGGFAGGAINAVGTSVNGVGASINRTVKSYGDGVMDYGNSVMDWTTATGTRGGTASNPLGLSGTKSQGKRGATSPSVYRPPPSAQKQIGATPAKKALPAPKTTTPKAGTSKTTAPATKGPMAVKKTAVAAKPGANSASKTAASGKKTVSGLSKPAAKQAPKTTPAAAAPKPATRANYGSGKNATNPLGLNF